MKKAQVRVLHAAFPYAGNGGFSANVDEYSGWWAHTALAMKQDERIESFAREALCDTPITMTRNRAVTIMQEGDFDFLLMCDSDMIPDVEFGRDPSAKKFWDAAFDFAYERMMRGIPTVIAAPYCGPPPNECIYIFDAVCDETPYEGSTEHTPFRLSMIPRSKAVTLEGIHPHDAAGTGLILYSRDAFDLVDPPYFSYEWTDKTESEKASTEDVFNTRNIAWAGYQKFGENVLFTHWDCWAAHCKVKRSGKPPIMVRDTIHESLRKAVLENHTAGERVRWIGEYTRDPARKRPRFTDDMLEPTPDPKDEHEGNGKPRWLIGAYTYKPAGEPIGEGTVHALMSLSEQLAQGAGPDAFLRIANPYPGDGQAALACLAGIDLVTRNHEPLVICVEPSEWKEDIEANVDGVDNIRGVCETEPLEDALSLPDPEGLDAVVIGPDAPIEILPDLIEAYRRHVRPSGLLIVLDREDGVRSPLLENATTIPGSGVSFIVQAIPELRDAQVQEVTDG